MQQKFAIYSEGQPVGTKGQFRNVSPLHVLYLTAFEQPVESGIFESQVKRYLCKLADAKGREIKISQLAFRPAALIGRDGLSFPFVRERAWFRSLKQDLARHKIESNVTFVPVILPRRWSFYFNIPVLMIVVALSVPILLFKVARGQYHIIHCRSYVSTFCALLVRFVMTNVKVVFDIRGFYPEEGLIQKSWKRHSFTFKVWKHLESMLIRHADHTIAVSEAFEKRVAEASGCGRCSLVYLGADLSKFHKAASLRVQTRAELGLQNNVVFAYCGGLGTWHDPAILAKVGAAIARNFIDAAILVLTPQDQRDIEAQFVRAGLESKRIRIMAIKPTEVPRYLCAADFGIVPLRDMDESDPASVVADTMLGVKVTEYMAAGLPVIVNKRVGGFRALMMRFKMGLFFDSENVQAIMPRLKNVIEDIAAYRQDCRKISEKFFSLDVAVTAYYNVYRQLIPNSEQAHASQLPNSKRCPRPG